MRIRQIRNATLVIDYAGSRLLVDPWFEAAGTGMLATSPWPERVPPLKTAPPFRFALTDPGYCCPIISCARSCAAKSRPMASVLIMRS